MAQRVYKQATIFNARIIGMRNLWEPSREYMGKPTEKPNYMATIIIPKTRQDWTSEPVLNDFRKAAEELWNSSLNHTPYQQIAWPMKDGDITDPGRAQADWRRGTWVLTGTSTSPITVTIVQNGVPVPLMNRAQVKPGDYVATSLALAVNSNNPRAVKCYCNNVMFMAPGEEIAVGNSVSATELMEQAKAQGLNVTGFGSSGAPGFGQGFTPPMGPPGSNGPMGVPPQGFGSAPLGGGAPQHAPVQPGQTAAFPSSGGTPGLAPPPASPPGQPGFGQQGFFNVPTGFPPRQ